MFVRKMIYRSDDDSAIAPPVPPVEPEDDDTVIEDDPNDLTRQFQARAEQGKRAGRREAWQELSTKTGFQSEEELVAAVNELRELRKSKQTEAEALAEERDTYKSQFDQTAARLAELERELFTRDRNAKVETFLVEGDEPATDVKGALKLLIADYGDTLTDEDGQLDEKAIKTAVKAVRDAHPSLFVPNTTRQPGFQSNRTPYRQSPDEAAKAALDNMAGAFRPKV